MKTKGGTNAALFVFADLQRAPFGHSIPLERHVDVDLHFLHTRSPAHALGNGSRQRRHLRVFGSALRRASRSASNESMQPSLQAS
jgi:hypothetical protein